MSMLLPNESYAIRGAALEVHKKLGCGFLEKVYQEALEIEFQLRGIPYEREKHLVVTYKGHTLQQDYFADFVCYGKVIVELKAVSELCSEHRAQVLNYLSISDLELGLLMNFGEESLDVERIVNFKKFKK